MNEDWIVIKDYKGHYQISSFGRVKSLSRKGYDGRNLKERILKPILNSEGYLSVNLYKNNTKKTFRIHRLVAKAFILNLNNKLEVNHKDGVKVNCSIDNLEWATPKENTRHAYKIGLRNNRGENHPKVILIKLDIYFIRDSNTPQKELAKMFKVSASHISRIKNKNKWKHVNES